MRWTPDVSNLYMRVASAAGLVALLGCTAVEPEPFEAFDAVLAGTVLRGPVMPVCQPDVSCNEPFSATFDVRRQGRTATSFTSGSNGAFTVRVPSGEIEIVPRADAPLMNPAAQRKQVVVVALVLNQVELLFDTGIR